MIGKATLRALAMNRTEQAWSKELSLRQTAGEIIRLDFEPEKLRLADNTFYTPDFRVVMADGTIEFHEVKGSNYQGYYCRDDAKVKIKVAAEQHPYKFMIVWKTRNGEWVSELF